VRLIFCFLVAVAAFAQTPSPAAGIEPAWNMAIVLEEIATDTNRLLPALEQLNAGAWVSKGASDTYVAQLQSSKEQARAIVSEAKGLAGNPEKLSAGLQLFFRFQGLESMLLSLEDATRKYQNPQLAQTLASTFAEGGANRDRFRNYIVTLAAEREKQFEVMDQEAQRCRAILMAPPARNTVKKK
jgi:hypothetical protein